LGTHAEVGRMLLHPAVGWIGATATLIVWHIPSVFMLGLRSEMWHGIEQASFFVTGLLSGGQWLSLRGTN